MKLVNKVWLGPTHMQEQNDLDLTLRAFNHQTPSFCCGAPCGPEPHFRLYEVWQFRRCIAHRGVLALRHGLHSEGMRIGSRRTVGDRPGRMGETGTASRVGTNWVRTDWDGPIVASRPTILTGPTGQDKWEKWDEK
ncbi:hypothetical protein HAX54_052406 [Datura stramonium]|uniref:Uncharacterized protein n=1 Tax=Datura stramonium TaxID=4076 RepID=A0ABS8RS57_DATST|nr:hypothetical protein [Datura stramonium]